MVVRPSLRRTGTGIIQIVPPESPYSSHSYLFNDVVNNIDNNIIRYTNTNKLDIRAHVEHGYRRDFQLQSRSWDNIMNITTVRP